MYPRYVVYYISYYICVPLYVMCFGIPNVDVILVRLARPSTEFLALIFRGRWHHLQQTLPDHSRVIMYTSRKTRVDELYLGWAPNPPVATTLEVNA
jgi:hypothetical protein